MAKIIEGSSVAPAGRFAICVSRFNGLITDELLKGAVDALIRHGVEDDAIDVYKCPGAFELPTLVQWVGEQELHRGIICIGAVIRGATPHFDYVASECASGVASVSRGIAIPVSFGVLTCNTIEQAFERAGTKAGNKGADAAIACIELANLKAKVSTAGAKARLKSMVVRKAGKAG